MCVDLSCWALVTLELDGAESQKVGRKSFDLTGFGEEEGTGGQVSGDRMS